MEIVRFGVVGLGCRGSSLLKSILLKQPEVRVTAVCDLYPDRVENAVQKVLSVTGTAPFGTAEAGEVFARNDVDAVLISAAWEAHIPLAIAAMRAGKAVACEVGGACSLQECFDLVEAYEQTHTPIMLMENCCFDRCELLATAMVRAGLFGRVVHCEGAYSHDLRDEIAFGEINRHYRFRNYRDRNCENYPTHELGPIAKILGINRGNRMTRLVCASTGSFGLPEYTEQREDLRQYRGQRFAQGDLFHTLITCENGETVLLRLDTTLPRFYTRNLTVRGTRGFYEMNTETVFLEGKHREEFWTPLDSYRSLMGNAREYEAEYLPALWRNITPEERAAGHGGMDYFEFRAFLRSLTQNLPMPVDVYDMASWMAVTPLTEESVRRGGAPVAIPDFTSGAWRTRPVCDVVPL